MSGIIDSAIALRIVYLLTIPFKKWPAYAEGIIDENGNKLKNASSNNWTMLHRLVCRIKKIVGVVPGGKSMLGGLAASYLLVKECIENDNMNPKSEEIMEAHKALVEKLSPEQIQDVKELMEDATGVAACSPGMGSMGKAVYPGGQDEPFSGGNGSKKLKSKTPGFKDFMVTRKAAKLSEVPQ